MNSDKKYITQMTVKILYTGENIAMQLLIDSSIQDFLSCLSCFTSLSQKYKLKPFSIQPIFLFVNSGKKRVIRPLELETLKVKITHCKTKGAGGLVCTSLPYRKVFNVSRTFHNATQIHSLEYFLDISKTAQKVLIKFGQCARRN